MLSHGPAAYNVAPIKISHCLGGCFLLGILLIASPVWANEKLTLETEQLTPEEVRTIRSSLQTQEAIAKGQSSYFCRDKEFQNCFDEQWKKASWWEKYIKDSVGKNCPSPYDSRNYKEKCG